MSRKYKNQPVAEQKAVLSAVPFLLKDHEGVYEFLAQNQKLLELLRSVGVKLHDYFPGSPLRLELIHDPEIENFSQLVVRVITELPVDDAMDRLDRFDYEWWLEHLCEAENKICVNLEFA